MGGVVLVCAGLQADGSELNREMKRQTLTKCGDKHHQILDSLLDKYAEPDWFSGTNLCVLMGLEY